MLRMLQGLVRAYSILDSHVEAMLPPAAVAEFQSGIDQCLQHYRWLQADAFRKGVHLWKDVPKKSISANILLTKQPYKIHAICGPTPMKMLLDL